jgi:prevent-host-death family protein
MRSWLVRDARAHLSEVIDAALKGEPQRVTRRGKRAVVVVSEEEWSRVAKLDHKMSFGEFLATFPLSPEEWAEVAPQRHRPRDPFAHEG